jgi:acyl-CoA thioesterase
MPGPLVSVTETLAVTAMARVRGLEAFKSSHLWTPAGARGVFGGQVIAQSIMAACKTVEGKDLHSQHVSGR